MNNTLRKWFIRYHADSFLLVWSFTMFTLFSNHSHTLSCCSLLCSIKSTWSLILLVRPIQYLEADMQYLTFQFQRTLAVNSKGLSALRLDRICAMLEPVSIHFWSRPHYKFAKWIGIMRCGRVLVLSRDKIRCGRVLCESTQILTFHSNPLSVHLRKWIGSMRIRSGLVFLVCSADTIKAHWIRIQCAFNVQCGQAFSRELDGSHIYNECWEL